MIKTTWFKRENPVYLTGYTTKLRSNRLTKLAKLDNLFKPEVVKND